jgi:hypothetical protein
VDRLGQERRGVGGIFAQRLRDRYDADTEAFAEKLLVLARLDLAAGEPGCVKDEHHVEPPIGGVGHEPLKLRARLGLTPPGMKVAVLLDQLKVVL